MRLRDWRATRGLSQRQLAESLALRSGMRCGQTHISAWERGVMPRRPWLALLADFTVGEVTADDFMKE